MIPFCSFSSKVSFWSWVLNSERIFSDWLAHKRLVALRLIIGCDGSKGLPFRSEDEIDMNLVFGLCFSLCPFFWEIDSFFGPPSVGFVFSVKSRLISSLVLFCRWYGVVPMLRVLDKVRAQRIFDFIVMLLI